MLENEAGADMRLVRQINKGMKIQAGGENMGCSKVGENPENQVIRLQCQDEVVRVCPGSPRSPRRAVATRLSSGSADREPSSSSYNVSSGTFYSCVSQITIAGVGTIGESSKRKLHLESTDLKNCDANAAA